MDAEIGFEDEKYIKIYVTDKLDNGHDITLEKDTGEIAYHQSEDYSDNPDERSLDENEYVGHAREFARYYAHQETEYEPFPVEKNLPGIKRIRSAIKKLSPTEFEQYFGRLHNQVISKGPHNERPVNHPSDHTEGEYVLYMVDVYVDDAGEVEAVSDIHLRWEPTPGDEKNQWNNDPFPNRKADARLQLKPDLVPTLGVFKEYIDYHLRCQIRDCYLGAGLEPPEEYRVLGRGQDEITARYLNDGITVYEPYHEHHVDIPGYEFEFDYGMGYVGETASKLASLVQDDAELEAKVDEMLQTGEANQDLVDMLEDRGYDVPDSQLVGE